jgi:hypothetical protein
MEVRRRQLLGERFKRMGGVSTVGILRCAQDDGKSEEQTIFNDRIHGRIQRQIR